MSSSWEPRKLMMLEVGDDQHISLNPDMITLIQLDDENGSVVILMSSGAKLTIHPEGENTPESIYSQIIKDWDDGLTWNRSS